MICSKHSDNEVIELFNKAIKFYDQCRYEESIEYFTHLLIDHVDIIEEWNIREYLGMSYYYLFDYNNSISHLKNALSLIQKDFNKLDYLHILDYLARSYFAEGSYKISLEYFTKASKYVSYYGGDDWAISRYLFHLEFGRCYLYNGQYDKSIKELKKSIYELYNIYSNNELKIRENLLNYEIGRAYVYNRNLVEAYQHLSLVDINLLDKSHHKRYYYVMLKYFYLNEEYEKLLFFYEQNNSIEIDDEIKSEIYYFIGISLYYLNRKEESKKYLEDSLNLNPPHEWIKENIYKFITELNKIN